jgi:hypothetical protein
MHHDKHEHQQEHDPKEIASIAAAMAGPTVANHGGTLTMELASKMVEGAVNLLLAAADAIAPKPEPEPATEEADPTPATTTTKKKG